MGKNGEQHQGTQAARRSKARPPSPIADELTSFFLAGDAALGLRSSWGPLVDLAMGGFCASSDPEVRVTDHRYGLGPARQAEVTTARAVRAALSRLSAEHQAVLFAVHGPTPWARMVDAGHGIGMAERVTKLVGQHLGLALLTRELIEGSATDKTPAGAWLVRLATAATPDAEVVAKLPREQREAREHAAREAGIRATRIRVQAEQLQREAEAAYLAAGGGRVRPKQQRTEELEAPKRIRRASFDPWALEAAGAGLASTKEGTQP